MNANWIFVPPPEHRWYPDSRGRAVRPVLIAAVICALAATLALGAVAIRSVRPVHAQPTPVVPLPTALPPPAFPLPTAMPLPTAAPPPLFQQPTANGPLPTLGR